MVRISFDPTGGAWSLVGTDHQSTAKKDKNGKIQATMNLGWFDVATTMHEFGHVLGMIHEHQNPRGVEIDWNVTEVDKWANETQGWSKDVTNRNILRRYSINSINGSKFDPESIMLYFFPGSLTNNGIGTHENLRLSAEDAIWLSKIYPGGTETPNSFYTKVYGESLYSAAEKSKKEAKMFKGKDPIHSSWKIVLLAVGILLVILLIVGGIIVYHRKKSH